MTRTRRLLWCVSGLLLWTLTGLAEVVDAQSNVNLGGALVNFGVSPPIFELTLGSRNKPNTLRVQNFGKQPIELEVSVFTWELDEQNKLQLVPPTEQSLDQWIRINPLRFTIAPGKSQAVRFSVRPRVRPEPGEHRAIIYLSDATQPTTGTRNVTGRVGVAVYGYVGEIVRHGSVHGVEIVPETNPVHVLFDVSSKGNAHVRLQGQYGIWSAAAYPGPTAASFLEHLNTPDSQLPEGMLDAGFLPNRPVLPGTRRTLSLQTSSPLPSGAYVLELHGKLGDTPLALTHSFQIP